MIRNFFRHLWESIKSLKRNFWMTLASVTTVTITLTLVAVFSMVLINSEKLAKGIASNVEISAYLQVDSTDGNETIINTDGQTVVNTNYHKVYDTIKKLDHVTKVTYSSKDEQLEKLQSVYGDTWNLYDSGSNPLLDVYIIQVDNSSNVKSVAEEVKQIAGVDDANYGGENSDGLFKLANIIRIWGLLGTAVLLLLAIFLISNTIKMTILYRQRDIEIMRLVGAKNSYIRGPFFFEGAWVGLLGAALPSLIIYFLYNYIYKEFNPNLQEQNLSLYSTHVFLPIMIASLFIIGIVIGSIGSTLSMRRYLKI